MTPIPAKHRRHYHAPTNECHDNLRLWFQKYDPRPIEEPLTTCLDCLRMVKPGTSKCPSCGGETSTTKLANT